MNSVQLANLVFDDLRASDEVWTKKMVDNLLNKHKDETDPDWVVANATRRINQRVTNIFVAQNSDNSKEVNRLLMCPIKEKIE